MLLRFLKFQLTYRHQGFFLWHHLRLVAKTSQDGEGEDEIRLGKEQSITINFFFICKRNYEKMRFIIHTKSQSTRHYLMTNKSLLVRK